MSRLLSMIEKGLKTPDFLKSNLMFETISGSIAYGISIDDSDEDIIGYCMPLKSHLFPALYNNYIEGFSDRPQVFDQFISHGVKSENKIFDFTIFNISKFFNLAMAGNINVLEILFTPRDCITFSTPASELIRSKRHLFLSGKIRHTCIGYAYSQMKSLYNVPKQGTKRHELYLKYGVDVKYMTHTLRLLNQAEQILTTGDLDLRANSDQLKACRLGLIPAEDVKKIFAEKERYLEKLAEKNIIPYSPPKEEIKQLLLDTIEHHYGKLEFIDRSSEYKDMIDKIRGIVNN